MFPLKYNVLFLASLRCCNVASCTWSPLASTASNGFWKSREGTKCHTSWDHIFTLWNGVRLLSYFCLRKTNCSKILCILLWGIGTQFATLSQIVTYVELVLIFFLLKEAYSWNEMYDKMGSFLLSEQMWKCARSLKEKPSHLGTVSWGSVHFQMSAQIT